MKANQTPLNVSIKGKRAFNISLNDRRKATSRTKLHFSRGSRSDPCVEVGLIRARAGVRAVEIKHEVVGWELKYGYIKLWGPEKEAIESLPRRFKIIAKFETLHDRHLDSDGRIYVGSTFMKHFGQGSIIRLLLVKDGLEVLPT